ncbi:MAG: YidC/Oxa1 family membrane protein insertase [Dehalococcoidia bacterium]
MDVIGDIFIVLLLQPMLNALIFLYAILFENIAYAIIALTVVTRLIFYPLTVKQLKSSATMQRLGPEMAQLKEKYKSNPQAQQKATMKLYKDNGVSPLGCLGPMLIQFPIWIGLYYAIIKGLGDLPDSFMYLSQRLYDWMPYGSELLPMNTQVPWLAGSLDLTQPDPTPILPLLVAVSTWAQQKIMQQPAMSNQQRQQQQIMLFMFPIMLGFLAFSFPSGLALYWFVSNIITVILQGFFSGWGNLSIIGSSRPMITPAKVSSDSEGESDDKEQTNKSNKRKRDSKRKRPTRGRSGKRRNNRS